MGKLEEARAIWRAGLQHRLQAIAALKSRWRKRTSESGKTFLVCSVCGRLSIAPEVHHCHIIEKVSPPIQEDE